MNNFEENFDEYIRDEIFVMHWINHLQFIRAMQKKGMYKELSDDTKIYGKIMQLLFENESIFEEGTYL